MRRPIIAIIALVIGATASVAQTPRERIGLYGNIAYGAMGKPAWSQSDGARGDLILVGCEALTGEDITVAAYLYYRGIKEPAEPPIEGIGEFRGVPANQFGAQWGYRSPNYRLAVASVRWRQRSESTSRTVQLFMPYEALDIGQGPYQVVYLIRMFVNGRKVDEFYTDEHRFVRNTGSRLREFDYRCMALMAGGPAICQFRLIGTDDPPAPAWGGTVDEVIAPTIAE